MRFRAATKKTREPNTGYGKIRRDNFATADG